MDVTRVKVCGITKLEDARLAAGLGAWAIGLILWPDSPRAVSPEAAEEIGQAMRRQLEVVGVFVNAPLDDVARAADRFGLTMLQLHGDEGPAYSREAARRTGAKVMKAARVKDAAQVRQLAVYRTDFHLLDAHTPDRPGGTGATFDWELAKSHRDDVPLVLSGGLTPDNVGEAVRRVAPFGVDTASGTESAPGRKDPAKVKAFFDAVEAAERTPA